MREMTNSKKDIIIIFFLYLSNYISGSQPDWLTMVYYVKFSCLGI